MKNLDEKLDSKSCLRASLNIRECTVKNSKFVDNKKHYDSTHTTVKIVTT